MGKSKKGNYHPSKGKPSGVGKPEGLGTNSKSYIDLEEKYTVGPDKLAPNVPLKHPNRNVDKEEYHRTRSESPGVVRKSESVTGRKKSRILPVELSPYNMTRSIFDELANYRSEWCISCYLPTHASGAEVNEKVDNKVFKNMLQSIEHMLLEKSVSRISIDHVLAPAYELLLNDTFWRGLSHGFAVFMANGYFKFTRLPFPVKEEVIIQNSFYISPFIPLLSKQEYFYLLVLSKKQAKLYRGDAWGMTEMPVPGMPNGIEDVVHFEEKDRDNVWRIKGKRGGKGESDFHGSGSGSPDEKENIALYMDEVDETILREGLGEDNAPLLLAGVEYMLPIFRQASEYKHIWPVTLRGSHEYEDLHKLHNEAMNIVQPYFDQKVNIALENYGNQTATGLSSSIPSKIIPAAFYARVAHLMLVPGNHIWGTFNKNTNNVTLHDQQEQGDICLFDRAATETFLNGGAVYFLDKDEMPTDSIMAAVMRY